MALLHTLEPSATPELRPIQKHNAAGSAHLAGPGAYREFYNLYAWCLNPFQSVQEIRVHLREAHELLASSTLAWQQEECRTNIYLLLCALSCSLGDYLSNRPWPLPVTAAARFSPSGAVFALKSVLNALDGGFRRPGRRRLRAWKASLERCIESVCRALVEKESQGAMRWPDLGADLEVVLSRALPDRLLRWQMRIPEAFRCQDMTHQDAMTMAQNYVDAYAGAPSRPVFVVGPRTAGAYFVPIIKAHLERSGIQIEGATTIRPKEGFSAEERSLLVAACASGARIVIVDDHPNTGNTFRLIVTALTALGAAPEDLVILAPDHAAQQDWIPLLEPIRVLTLAPSQFQKARLLQDDARLLASVQDFLGTGGEFRMGGSSQTALAAINSSLTAHYPDSFQVRLKRVFAVEETNDSRVTQRLVLAKSVGWGWLGYHAFLAAERLTGLVPQLLGFSGGLMFVEWVVPRARNYSAPTAEQIAALVPTYLAARVRLLRLEKDPTIGALGLGVSGRDRILTTLRRPYGRLLRSLARSRLERQHRSFVAPTPALVDGRMLAENWVVGDSGIRKVDFEQHNFGGAEENFVDVAHDLAGAIQALNLDAAQQERMVAQYCALSGDAGACERLILHKLRVGMREMDRAADALEIPGSAVQHRQANARFVAGRNFLTDQFNLHHAGRLTTLPNVPLWSERIFYLDLDGVFDLQLIGFFPHTTPNGLRALALLQHHGYSVVPNTGRSAAHVRNYCERFGLPGGIAEYGAVFVDCVAAREELLFSDEQRAELERCRTYLAELPGVYCDPDYQATIRAYRYHNRRWAGLGQDEISDVLRAGGFAGLEVIAGPADTHFVPKGVNKGSAVAAVKSRLGRTPIWSAAIGDSKQDIPMLEQVDRGFVVANASRDVKSYARSAEHVRILRQSAQSGLLEAVLVTLAAEEGRAAAALLREAGTLVRPSIQPLDAALEAFESPALKRWFVAFAGPKGKGPTPGQERGTRGTSGKRGKSGAHARS